MSTSSTLGTVGLVRGIHGDFFLPRNDLIFKQIRTYGAHTRPEIAMVRRFANRGDTVVDIGAHVGTFSLPLAYSVGWSGKVLAFEPNPTSVELLRLNVVLNGLQSVIAISSVPLSSGEADYYVVGNRTTNSGASHLSSQRPSPPVPRRRRADRPQGIVPAPATTDHTSIVDVTGPADEDEPLIRVTTASLDAVLADRGEAVEKLSLIKIDVEGMEEAVIAGASATIQTHRPVVYFEVALGQASRFGLPDLGHIDYLRSLDYRFFRNVAARNAADDEFDIAQVGGRTVEELTGGDQVADLLAVPIEIQLDRYL